MISQIKLILLLLNLFIGLGVIGFLHQTMKSTRTRYLILVFRYTIILNLLLLLFFILKYLEINIWQVPVNMNHSPLLPVFLTVTYAFCLALVITLTEISMAFRHKKTTVSRRLTVYALALMLVGFVLLMTSGVYEHRRPLWLLYAIDNSGLIFPLFEISVLLHLLLYSRKIPDGGGLIKAFSVLYLLRYPLIASALVLPASIRMFFVVFITNTLNVVWVKTWVQKYETGRKHDRDSVLRSITLDFGITAREMDVLKLIVSGRSNKEIEEELFISYHTVKNHIYHLFQKLNISNRYQLIRIFDRHRQDD